MCQNGFGYKFGSGFGLGFLGLGCPVVLLVGSVLGFSSSQRFLNKSLP